MTSNSSLYRFKSQIHKLCAEHYAKLAKENDEVKQFQIQKKIQAITTKTLLKEIKKMSNSQWDEFIDECFESENKQIPEVFDQVDKLVYKTAKDIKEYKKYEKIKNIGNKSVNEISLIVDEANLNKKQLTRLLEFAFAILGYGIINNLQSSLYFYEFIEAGNIVQRRLGFDYNWLSCLSLIQLHENLIKKRITELDGQIEKDEPLSVSIAKLSKLIKDKEKRDISFTLLLSNSVKVARDTMTHEGFKHAISKENLTKVFNEIIELENTLYPDNKKN